MRGTVRRNLTYAQPGRITHPFSALARLRPGPAVGTLTPPITFQLALGPYQNNGATPWYANIPLGTPGQSLKIALDTGSNFIWTTSTLCDETGSCKHHGGGEFNFAASATFSWVDQTPQNVSFGPWGTMVVETGSDYIGLPDGAALPATFFLARSYGGAQFEQLDWDGGIGLPSGSAYADPSVSFVVAEMMDQGLIDPAMPYLSFCTSQKEGTGTALLGGFDLDAFDPYTGVFMRWSPYTAFSGVEYIWSTALNQYLVGKEAVASNVMFCLDSGSSQFKGDDHIMNTTLRLVGEMNLPDVTLVLGTTTEGTPARIVVPSSVYMVQIQAGPEAGQTLPQFNPLGLTDLVLVGSVLMDQLYAIYEYEVTQTKTGYELAPVGMWLFNKKDGPPLIQTRSEKPFAPKPKTPSRV